MRIILVLLGIFFLYRGYVILTDPEKYQDKSWSLFLRSINPHERYGGLIFKSRAARYIISGIVLLFIALMW